MRDEVGRISQYRSPMEFVFKTILGWLTGKFSFSELSFNLSSYPLYQKIPDASYRVCDIPVLHRQCGDPLSEDAHWDGVKPESRILEKGHKKSEKHRAFREDSTWDRDVVVPLRDGTEIRADIWGTCRRRRYSWRSSHWGRWRRCSVIPRPIRGIISRDRRRGDWDRSIQIWVAVIIWQVLLI